MQLGPISIYMYITNLVLNFSIRILVASAYLRARAPDGHSDCTLRILKIGQEVCTNLKVPEGTFKFSTHRDRRLLVINLVATTY